MKGIITSVLFLAICLSAYSQGGWTRPNFSYGTISNRASIDSLFFYPTGCGEPTTLKGYNLKKAALYFDSCNHKYWVYDPKLSAWDSLALGAGSVDSTNQIGVKNIADLRAYPYYAIAAAKKSSNDRPFINLLGYYERNDGGGGQFYWDDTATAIDNGGAIIKPTDVSGAGRWKRIFDREVNVLWFGAKRDYTTDASPAINTCITVAAAIVTSEEGIGMGHGVVYIPSGNYKCNSPIYITTTVEVKGEGSGFFPFQETRLTFDNTAGIDIRQFIYTTPTKGFGAESVKISNLYLRNIGASTHTSADSLKHGLFTNTKVYLEGVAAQNFSGNGFCIYTSDSGNANNSVMIHCNGYYNERSGLFLQGGESNNCGIYSCDFSANGMAGVLDNSFLGNIFYDCHVSSNGIRVGSTFKKSWCRWMGKTWQAIKYPNQKGVEPGVTSGWENYWFENTSIFASPDTTNLVQWSTDSTFWFTGAYAVVNTAPASNFFGCYSEGSQGANYLNTFSIMWGGDNAALFVTKDMLYLHAVANRINVDGGGIRVSDKDSINTYIAITNNFGLQITSEKATHSGLQIKYKENDRTTRLFGGNTLAQTAMYFTGAGHDLSKYGLTTLNRNTIGTIYNDAGLFWGAWNDDAYYRRILAGKKRPSDFEHAAGEWCLNIGTNTDTVGWRCTVGGTPGTWVGVLSANSVNSTNTSVGTGYSVAINATINIKSLKEKYGILLDSATANEVGIKLDTATVFPAIRTTITPADTFSNLLTETAGAVKFGGRSNQTTRASFRNVDTLIYDSLKAIYFRNADGTNRFVTDQSVSSLVSPNGLNYIDISNNDNLLYSYFDGSTERYIGFQSGVARAKGINRQVSVANMMMVKDTITHAWGYIDIPTSETYTPTLNNTTNVSASTAYAAQYIRVGNVVTVSGEVDIDPTTTLTLTVLGVSLPIASAIANTFEVGGTSADELNTAARVAGNVANDRAEIRFTPVDVTNRTFSFTFTYRVL